ncbi:MAG: HAMP domain-containing protein [Calditrichaeota bacterium]|nr:MAG: HAMP domain-containing protein [Calditrichota bacterium]
MPKINFLTLRTKLILIITCIIIPLMVSSLSIIGYLINRESLQLLKQDVIKTITAFNEFQKTQSESLKRLGRFVSTDKKFKVLLQKGKRSPLNNYVQELKQIYRFDLCLIFNTKNRILYQYPQNLKINLETVKSRRRFSAIENQFLTLNNRIYQVAINSEQNGKGTPLQIILGKQITGDQVLAIKKITNSDISLLASKQIVTTTLPSKRQIMGLQNYVNDLLSYRKYDLFNSREPVEIDGKKFLVNLLPLKGLNGKIFGYLIVQRSTESLLNFNARIKNTLFIIITVLWLCTGLVVGIFIQRHMVQPITNLVEAVNAIAQGDLSPNLKVESNDEIGFLYQGFNRMASEVRNWTRKLKEKNMELKKHSQRIEEINQEMQDFVYVVSHDLKSPLVNIQGFTGRLAKLFLNAKTQLEGLKQELEKAPLKNGHVECLQKVLKEFDERGPQSFEFIHSASKKMNDMIEELLTLSRVETRRMPMEATNIGEEIDNILKAAEYEIQEKKIRVEVDPMPVVVCERMRINQVFANLITNAIKFIGKGDNKFIKIGYRDKGDYHLFYVKDNGIGIDPKDHKKIFRVFYRGDTRVSGHGMGLSLAKKIIMKHEGKIWLESVPGKGSTFYFTIKKYKIANEAEKFAQT